MLGMPIEPQPDRTALDLLVGLSLGEVSIGLLRRFLGREFAAAGWRVPYHDGARVVEIESDLDPGRVALRYGPHTDAEAHELPSTPVDMFLAHRAACLKLVAGDFRSAALIYSDLGQRHPEHEALIAERLLELLCAREDTHGEAVRVAVHYRRCWPRFIPAHLALATTATARGAIGEAADHLDLVGRMTEGLGQNEIAVRSALQGARLLAALDPERSSAFHDRVARCRPSRRAWPNATRELGP
jgi:hypothetical protein